MTWEPDEKLICDLREVSEGPNEDKSQMGFCELKGVTLQHKEVFWGPYEATRYQVIHKKVSFCIFSITKTALDRKNLQ